MENLIVLNVDGNTKEEVVKNLADELNKHGKLNNLSDYIQAVYERETEITTGFGNGVAIPHGKTDAVKESSFVFGKLKNEIDWNSLDKKPVNLVFLLAIPNKEAGTTHLRLLSQIAMRIMDEDFVEDLREAKTETEINSLLNTIGGEQ